ncbi:recombinase family protein [Jeotgalibacillus proteolyticus]|uniref:recombinase family protein n=1 Tax=Jeotgalibacillus proteolyticus TaxID=2082395 RepID=UPI003CF4EC7D
MLDAKKYKVFFRRVSTTKQDMSLQESADAIHREHLHENEIVIINENGVSANKLKINQRPQMLQLISMIENYQVETIYAFDRSRLFRDFYEALFFGVLCKRKNVNLIFTSPEKGYQATNNALLEGFLNIVGDVEGKNIARRTEEARKRYPPRKLGYLKEKDTKKYIKDPSKEKLVYHYFSELSNLSSVDELDELLDRHKKLLKTTTLQLVKISLDPFYAGYDLTSGKNGLGHVTPYLSLEKFEKMQQAQPIISSYIMKIEKLKASNSYHPFCGKCGNNMTFKYETATHSAWYTCSRNHKKIMITISDLSSAVQNTLDKVVHHLNIDRLYKDSEKCIKNIKALIEAEIELLKKKETSTLKRLIADNTQLVNFRSDPLYKKLSEESNQKVLLLKRIRLAEEAMLDNKRISIEVKNHLNACKDKNPFLLRSMVIDSIHVHHNELDISIRKFEYLTDIQPHYVQEGKDFL